MPSPSITQEEAGSAADVGRGGMEGWNESDADDMTVVHDSGMIFILIFGMLLASDIREKKISDL